MTEIHRIERTCRRLGVSRAARRELTAELVADLAAAEAAGGRAADVLGTDPAAFARAVARGEVRGRWRIGLVTAAVLLGALPGAVVGLFVAYGTSSTAFAQLVGVPDGVVTIPSWLLLALYALGGVLAWLGAVLTVGAALRSVDDPHRRRTVRLLAATLPAAAAFGLVVAVTYGDQLEFSTAPPTPEIEALLVVALTAIGAAATRLLVRWRSAPATEI
jgi:hypothetical protein